MNKYTEELRKILKQSELEALINNDELVGTEHILLSLLVIESKIGKILKENNLTYDIIKAQIKEGNNSRGFIFYKNELLKIIEKIVLESGDIDEEITLSNLVIKILNDKTTEAYKILNKLNINIDKLKESIESIGIEEKPLLIKTIATNLNNEVKKNPLDKVIGRDKEIDEIIQILARKNKNNPILIGEAGVGKTALVEELARRITSGNVPTFLKNKEIYNLNLANVIAGTKYRGEFEEKLSKIINELENVDNIILFIDEIHTVVGAGGAEGAIDASNILKPALARGKIKCIGATTLIEFKNSIEKDKALERRFQKVYIKEPNEEETKTILKKIKKSYEKYHNVIIKDDMLALMIKLSKKYIKYRSEPDRSIDILDEICACTSINEKDDKSDKIKNKIKKLSENKNNYLIKNDILNASITKKEINKLKEELKNIDNKKYKNTVNKNTLKKVLENKINSKIFELEDKKYINELNTKLKNKFIGQDNIIEELLKIIDSFLIKENKKPETILLKGKTGTGKTSIVKEIAKELSLNLITLNMEEYTSETSINKLIGSPAGYVGYDEKNTVFESLKTFPISIILVENYTYSHPKVFKLINNIIETGILSLSNNEKIYLNNTIFIFTSKTQNNSLGFIKNEKEEKNNMFNHTLKLNDLNIENISKIIKNKKPQINNSTLNEIINKTNYKNENAKNIDKVLSEISVNI